MATVRTVAVVDIRVFNNVTWNDVFQYGDDTDLTWDFNNKTFALDVKENAKDSTAVLLSMTDANGRIVVEDAVARILSFNVPDTVIRDALIPQIYVYDLVMIDNAGVRTMLMRGQLTVEDGVTN